jgi:hypothetical protein
MDEMYREGFYCLVAGWKSGAPSRWLWDGPKCTTVMLTPLTIEDEKPNVFKTSSTTPPVTHCHIAEEMNSKFGIFWVLSNVFIDRHCSTVENLFIIVAYSAA